MRINLYLFKSTMVGALGGLLFGFDTAVIAGAIQTLTITYSLTHWQLGATVSIALFGTILGAMTSGAIGQRYGGRETLRLMAVFYVISAVGCAFAWSWPALLAFRFIGGIGIGGSSVLGPVYIAELAPAKWRGRLVGLFQINIVIGILLAYLSNFLIARQNLGLIEWRWEFGVAAVPAVLFLILLFGIPRSSRWLVTRNRLDEARKVLQMMGTPDSEAELAEIKRSLHLERSTSTDRLFQRKYALPIFLAISIGMFNQLSGINAILYYLNSIFADAGYNSLSSNVQSVLVGTMNLIATLAGMSLIDKVGRKRLLLAGGAGMAFCLSAVAWVFYAQQHLGSLVWLLIAYIAFFAISQGSVIWVYISEVFPNRIRSKGQSLGSSSHWIMNAAIALTFPWISGRFSPGAPFVAFAAMMVVQFVVVLFVYPETKGVTLEAMEQTLGIVD